MIYLVALLVAAGGAYIGAAIGLGMFAMVFEVLREFDRDVPLDSKFALAAFSTSFAAVGFAVALTLAWRWRGTADAPPSRWKTLTVAALAGGGAAALASLDEVTGFIGRMFQLNEFGELLVLFVATAVVALTAGAILAVLIFGRAWPRKAQLAAIPVAIIGGLAIIMGGLIADKQFSYPTLGTGEREALVEIRTPAEMERGPLQVALRTPSGTRPASENYWFRQGDQVTVRTRVDLSERTRERVLVISIDGRADLTVPLRFVSNPRVMFEYGPWQPLGPDGMAIRVLTR